MLIALLAVLGVDVIVIIAFLAVVLARRRWVSHRPSAFKGAIHVVDGQVPGLTAQWRRGYGRWIRDILIWEKAPFLFRSQFVPVDTLAGPRRTTESGEVKRLGKHVTAVPILVEGDVKIEVAAAYSDHERVYGPFLTAKENQRAPSQD